MMSILTIAARQLLYSVILSRSIYLCLFFCRFLLLQMAAVAEQPQMTLTPGDPNLR